MVPKAMKPTSSQEYSAPKAILLQNTLEQVLDEGVNELVHELFQFDM